jgi:ketosteroid isomerase-like protein
MLIRQSRARKASVEHANTSPKGTAFPPDPAFPEGLVALSSKANDLSIYGTNWGANTVFQRQLELCWLDTNKQTMSWGCGPDLERAMSKIMTLERATEFGSAWNSRDPDLVASFFADNGVYHASVGPDHLGKTYLGKEEIRNGVKAFFERFPDGRFENLKVRVAGDIGSFEWDFVATDASGKPVTTAGCDLLAFRGDKVILKNAFRKAKG